MLDASTGREIIFQHDVDELEALMADHRRYSANRVLENLESKDNQRVSDGHTAVLLSAIPLAGLLWISARLYAIRRTFAEEFDWYEGSEGYRRPPQPRGDVNFSMQCVTTAVLYPSLYSYLTLGFSCQSIDVVPATFLTIMVREFKNELRAIHWAGSGEQLGHSSLAQFVASYTGWLHPENAFQFLFRSKEAFETSFAVLEARERLRGSVLNSLFQGGLCLMAVVHFKEENDALDLARALLGRTVVYYKDCSAAAVMAGLTGGLEAGATAAGTTSAVIGGTAVLATVSAKAAAITAKASSLCPLALTFAPLCIAVVILIVAAVVAAIVGSSIASEMGETCNGEAFYTLTRDKETGKLKSHSWAGHNDHVSRG